MNIGDRAYNVLKSISFERLGGTKEEFESLKLLQTEVENEGIKTFIEEFEVDSSNGFDKIEFMFSANSGEHLKPMGYIISGGEMSRFMLSIKAQSSRYSEVETFIFDEIDVGISGNVAKIVAQKFVKISNDTQIIAITHLPQISAIADHNLLIEKKVDGESTKTYVRVLNHDEKINEIIRLTGGEIGNQTSISHARDLINQANNIKNSLKKV
jgi:DNA repair protein RecN (Recombination protein N)